MRTRKLALGEGGIRRLTTFSALSLTLLSLASLAPVIARSSPVPLPEVPIGTTSGEPGAWTKSSGNPVLLPTQAWEGTFLWSPHVMKDGLTYKIWYSGQNGIGYATSTDGLAWSKHSGNPVLTVGAPGLWDASGIGVPYVLKDGSGYKMWYWGLNVGGLKQIGYATSPDGVAWTKYPGNPVLSVGGPGSWDAMEAGTPCVLYQNGTYRLWYTGQDNAGHYRGIGYASSPDGTHWTRYGSNPVLTPTPASWDQNGVLGGRILFDGTTYRMWYFGKDISGTNRIGYARSPDGLQWTKYGGNPVLNLGLAGAWDAGGVYFPSVIFDGGSYKMWYVGEGSSAPPRMIGYATALEQRVIFLPSIMR